MTDFRAYTPKLGRHIRALVINGFFARDLDAEDHAFIESVRKRGYIDDAGSYNSLFRTYANTKDLVGSDWRVAARNTNRAGSEYFDSDTLDYFEQKWALEDQVREERRLARERALSEQHERREARARDRTIAAETLAQEQATWDAKQAAQAHEREHRMLRTMLSDLEWDQANPNRVLHEDDDAATDKKGTPVAYSKGKVRVRVPSIDTLIPSPRQYQQDEYRSRSRFYEPQWDRDERVRKSKEREHERRKMQAMFAQQEASKREAAAQANAAAEREAAAQHEAARIQSAREDAARLLVLARERTEQDRLAREAAARAGDWKINHVQSLIMIALKGSYPKIWTVEELMTYCKCDDRNLIIYCGHMLASRRQANRTMGTL